MISRWVLQLARLKNSQVRQPSFDSFQCDLERCAQLDREARKIYKRRRPHDGGVDMPTSLLLLLSLPGVFNKRLWSIRWFSMIVRCGVLIFPASILCQLCLNAAGESCWRLCALCRRICSNEVWVCGLIQKGQSCLRRRGFSQYGYVWRDSSPQRPNGASRRRSGSANFDSTQGIRCDRVYLAGNNCRHP